MSSPSPGRSGGSTTSRVRPSRALRGDAIERAAEVGPEQLDAASQGVSLHSYRYSWAERAKTVGYPERFAQEALGHNSKAVHRAYARRAKVTVPSLEDYEKQPANQKVIQLQVQHGATVAAPDASRSVTAAR